MRLWRFSRKLLISGLLLAFCTAQAVATETAELARTWVRTGNTIDEIATDRIIKMFQENSETNELLREVAAKLGASHPAEIMKIVNLCEPSNPNQGYSYSRLSAEKIWMPIDGSEPEWSQATQDKLAKALDIYVSNDSVAAYVISQDSASVCVKPDRPLLGSFLTLVHELTHFNGFRIMSGQADVLSFPDEASFMEHELYRPGGEYEAFVTATRAHLKYRGRISDHTLYDVMEKYFNSDGEVIDREGLSKYILDDLQNREKFRKYFGVMVNYQYRSARIHKESYSNDLVSHQNNKTNSEKYIAQFERYLNEAKRNSYPRRLIDDVEKKLELERLRLRQAQKRIADLEHEIDVLSARMAAIQERLGHYLSEL